MAEQNAAAQDPEQTSAAPEEPAGPKPPLIPPILVRLSVMGGILAVLAVGAIFLVTDVIAPRIHAMGQIPAATAPKEKKVAPGEVVTVADLVINPAGTGGRRYLKVTAGIEVTNKKVVEELGLRTAQVRDLLIRDLSARTLDELTDAAAKEEMRTTLVDELNEILGPGKVSHVYFTEYVVQ